MGRGIGKTETDASIELLQQLKRRGHPDAPPPLVSDGWGGHREALIETYGEVPDYSGRGRPPSLKQPGKEWQYLQMVKQRDNGRVIGVEPQSSLATRNNSSPSCTTTRPTLNAPT
ncbi:MAG: hypothetical protein Kow0063_42300 [Anaerolineae bacterium]